MAYNQPESLGSILSTLIDRMGLRQKLNEARVVEAWAVLAGPQINGVTNAAWVRGRTLYVKILSSTWRQELHLGRQVWRDRLNESLGEDLVEEIVFR